MAPTSVDQTLCNRPGGVGWGARGLAEALWPGKSNSFPDVMLEFLCPLGGCVQRLNWGASSKEGHRRVSGGLWWEAEQSRKMGVPGQGEPSAGGLRTSSAPSYLLGLEPAGPHCEAGLAASTIT